MKILHPRMMRRRRCPACYLWGLCLLVFSFPMVAPHRQLLKSDDDKHDDSRDVHHGLHRACGTNTPSDADLRSLGEIVMHYINEEDENRRYRRELGPLLPRVRIPVYFHVITDSFGRGSMSQSLVDAQIAVLNEGFEGTKFSFVLVGTTCTANDEWYNQGYDNEEMEVAMKTALKQGGAATLNVYVFPLDDYLGYSYLPPASRRNPIKDGVVIERGTVPGGWSAPANMGKTLTHEVGHFMGLLHTFEGNSCGLVDTFAQLLFQGEFQGLFSGDGVIDTPVTGQETRGCPLSKNSCPLRPGSDLVDNYMDYSDDFCQGSFTWGQVQRMEALWRFFRHSEHEDPGMPIVAPIACDPAIAYPVPG